MYHYNFYLTDPQKENLWRWAERADVPIADLLRRMVDHCSQGHVLDQIVPSMSGQLAVTKG